MQCKCGRLDFEGASPEWKIIVAEHHAPPGCTGHRDDGAEATIVERTKQRDEASAERDAWKRKASEWEAHAGRYLAEVTATKAKYAADLEAMRGNTRPAHPVQTACDSLVAYDAGPELLKLRADLERSEATRRELLGQLRAEQETMGKLRAAQGGDIWRASFQALVVAIGRVKSREARVAIYESARVFDGSSDKPWGAP